MKKNRVIINISGGNVQSILADNPNSVEVIIFDVDNLVAEGKTDIEITKEWKDLIKGKDGIEAKFYEM